MFDEITLASRAGDTSSCPAATAGDPVVALWSERNRLAAEGDEADAAGDEARTAEIDERMLAIDQTICRTLATTLPGVLAQMELLALIRNAFAPDEDDGILEVNIRAAIATMN